MSNSQGDENMNQTDLANLNKPRLESVCEKMTTTQLEATCREVLGWTDELIARSRKLDMKRAIVIAEQSKQPTPQSKVTSEQPNKLQNEEIRSTQLAGTKTEPANLHRVQYVRERRKEEEETAEDLAAKAESLLMQVDILKPYTSGENYIQKAPELLKLITHEINLCSSVLRTRFAKLDKELQQLIKADLLATHYINNSEGDTDRRLSETCIQFKCQLQIKLTSLRNLQTRYGELLLKLHSSVQP